MTTENIVSTEPTQDPDTAAGDQQQSTEPPAWASQLVERLEALEGRASQLGKDLGRVRSKVKSPEQQTADAEPATGGEQQPSGVTRDELVAAQRLGKLRAGLSEDADQHIEARLEEGASFGEVLREAELLSKFAKPAPQPPKAPKAHGGTPAQQTNGGASFTMAELMEISKSDPARFDKIMSDPNVRVPGMK